jgi:predicted acylesterase/phospholipase RssA
MIDEYVNRLIENLPEETKKLQHIDLVLDGGIFNGSYLVGSLYFLKEMERRRYIKIERISGCSIGSIVAFLYWFTQYKTKK